MATQNIFNLTDTWNAGGTTFTAIKMNATDTASAAGSMLIDLQVGGASQFKVTKAGAATITTIELGHASDTTLSRVSAGVVAIEGVEVTTNSATQSLSNKTLSSPTLSGTVSGSTFTFSHSTNTNAFEILNPDTGTNGANDLLFTSAAIGAGFTTDNRNWGIHQNVAAVGDFVLKVSTATGGSARAGTAVMSFGKSGGVAFGNPTGGVPGTLGHLNCVAVTASGAVTANSGTAIPAGGTAGAGLMVSSTANFGVFFGSGAPTLSAAKGSLYMRSDGSGINDRMYVNTDGASTWTAVTTVA